MRKIVLLLFVCLSTVSYAKGLSLFGGVGMNNIENAWSETDLDSSPTLGLSYIAPVNSFVSIGVYTNYIADAMITDYRFDTFFTSLSIGLISEIRLYETDSGRGFYLKGLIGANKTNVDATDELDHYERFWESYYEDDLSFDSADFSREIVIDLGLTVAFGLGFQLNDHFSIEAMYQSSLFDTTIEETVVLTDSDLGGILTEYESSTAEYMLTTVRFGAVFSI